MNTTYRFLSWRGPREVASFRGIPHILALIALTLFSPINPLAAQDAPQPEEEAYGYFRVVEGRAILTPAGEGERQEIELHQPLLAGDRLEVDSAGRTEILLSDWNLLRLDGDTDVIFHRLAYSPDSEDTETRLELRRGNLQFLVAEDYLGDEDPAVDTANATIYLHRDGVYRISTDPAGWTQVVVRSGSAEVLSERGSTIVRAGEEALVEGDYQASTHVAQAGRRDSLERWGEDLDSDARDSSPYVDEKLRYAAAPLEDHGSWLSVEGRRAWRPYAAADWRPYWQGRWVYTPSGLSWVSYEPWGWVPYHYGSWDLVPGYGWVWFPGHSFSVAHVEWYWGPDQVAWFPSGYYSRYYSQHYGAGFQFGHGVYGYAGGSWDPFDDWFFCPPRYLGSRRQSQYLRTGRSVRGDYGHRDLPRGFITSDTRDLTPDRWRNHQQVEEILKSARRADGNRPANRPLPDVTAFVAREPRLSPEILRKLSDPDPIGHRQPRPTVDLRKNDLDRAKAVAVSPSKPQPRVEAKDRSEALPRVRPQVQGRQPEARQPVEVRQPVATRPEVYKPREGLRERPQVQRPEVQKPVVQRPEVQRPRIEKPVERSYRPERVEPRAAPRGPVASRPSVERKIPSQEPRAREPQRPEVKSLPPARALPKAQPREPQQPEARRSEVKASERPSEKRSERPTVRKAEPRKATGGRPQVESRSSSGSRAGASRRPTGRASSPKAGASGSSSRRSTSSASSNDPPSRSSTSRASAKAPTSKASTSSSRSSGRSKASTSTSRKSAPQKRPSKPPAKRRQ